MWTGATALAQTDLIHEAQMQPGDDLAAGRSTSCCRAPRCWLSLKIRSQLLLLYGLIALVAYGCMVAIAAGGIFAVRYPLCIL